MTTFQSIDATTGDAFGAPFISQDTADVEAACKAAMAAFDSYRAISPDRRAAFLDLIGEEIMNLGDGLIQTAMRETGLPKARLEGERGRTVGQLGFFADVVRRGDWAGLRVDQALPDRSPPRPDLRLRMIPVGPVAVFGASNFPLAFSTAGGDTASALAAGCPVVVKGHPAHPATGAAVAEAVRSAASKSGMPDGVFGYVIGLGNELGGALVKDPRIAAVGFTGSRAGGLALLELAQARPVPIPVYAEMSSINPVLLLPSALANRAEEIGAGYVGSLTLGAGQFCTNPGLVLAIEGKGLEEFINAASNALSAHEPAPMLTGGIHQAYETGVASLAQNDKVKALAYGRQGEGVNRGKAALFVTDSDSFLADDTLAQEVFGASSLIVRCKNEADLKNVILSIEGQLTITLQTDAEDEAIGADLLPLLERKAGRILVNGWPTGVEVAHAMVHGGPYPATSDSRTTSVGSLSIDRFLRPVSYQNFPPQMLPTELRD